MAHAATAFVQCWPEVTLVDSTGCLCWRWVIQIVQGLHDQLSVDLRDHWSSDASDFSVSSVRLGNVSTST